MTPTSEAMSDVREYLAAKRATPGPWNTTGDELVPERGAVYVQGPDGWDTQAICDCSYSQDMEVDEANARLIAAAPDMLSALKTIGALLSENYRNSKKTSLHDDELWGAYSYVIAAIRKAEATS